MGMTRPGTDCETLNQLPYMGPVPIVTHVHGAHVNWQSDGYPEAWWLADADNIPGIYAMQGKRYTTSMDSGQQRRRLGLLYLRKHPGGGDPLVP